MKKVTSFTHLVTGEGDRIAYTYSEISETGELKSQNNKGNFIVMDEELTAAIQTINSKIAEKLSSVPESETVESLTERVKNLEANSVSQA